MPTPDTLNRIRAADPARELPEETEAERRQAEALLERVVAEPVERPKRGPRFSRRRVLVLAGAAAAAVAAAVAAIAPDGERVPAGLATRAYAKTNPADGLIHEVVEMRFFDNQSRPPVDERFRGERWVRPTTREYRWLYRTLTNEVAGETALDRDAQRVWSRGTDEIQVTPREKLSPEERGEGEATGALGLDPHAAVSIVQQFRRAYERGLLRDAGPSELEGRPTRRYVATLTEEGPRAPGRSRGPIARATQTWHVDAKSALPLAMTMQRTIDQATGPDGRQRLDQKLLRYEKLDPTPENLRKLRFVGPPRG